MEALMKRLVLGLITVCLTLFLLSNTLFAHESDSEFAAAFKYYNSKNYKKAIELFKEYVKKDPDPAAYYIIGYSLYKLGKHDEANEYFKEAFLIDPAFSLEKYGLKKEGAEVKPEPTEKPLAEEKVPAKKSEAKPEAAKPAPKTSISEKPKAVPPVPAATKPVQPAAQKTIPQKLAKTEAKKVEPQKIQPPAGMPSAPMPQIPKPKQAAPGVSPGISTALVAGFGMIMLVIFLAVYIFGSLCLFLIAKKLNVPAPWTAWIPLVNLWTIVTAAGKPWWWILLIFIPIVGPLVVLTYLWILITENCGKNKWLGLLMLAPVANLVWLGILAFSKSEKEEQTKTMVLEPPAESSPPEEQF